jgi:3-oxoacyl-[acyl-carrier-protein] synthase II
VNVRASEELPFERVAVTGVGVVSSLAVGALPTFRRLVVGDRGFSPVSAFDPNGARCRIAFGVDGLDPSAVAPYAERNDWSRTDALGVLAASEALGSARFSGGRLGIAHAGTAGAMLETERDLFASAAPFEPIHAARFLTDPLSATTERLVGALGGSALSSTLCAACSSSAIAVVQAMDWVQRGTVDVALAGGADGLCALTFFGFEALGALDPDPCRPFDIARRGLSLGEAGAFLVLEREGRARARDAPILAFLSGAAVGAEAYHVTHPEPSGERAAELVRSALDRARLAPGDIDYVNAHGTGTQPNDRMEAKALRAALGDAVSTVHVSSSKGQLGHTLGAAGALEAVVTVLALSKGEVPPTAGLVAPEDPELRHVMGRGIARPLRAALSCSFGFGGTGAVLLFENAEARDREIRGRPLRVVVTGMAAFGSRGERAGLELSTYLDPEPRAGAEPSASDPLAGLDPSRSRRFDRPAAFVTSVVGSALADAKLGEASAGLVMGTAFGNVERSVRFIDRAVKGGPRAASPAEFPHLVVSAASGNASIYLGLRGPVFAVSDRETSAESAIAAAVALLGAGQANAFAAGAVEAFDPVVEAIHAHLAGAGASVARGEGSVFLVLEDEAAAATRGARMLARMDGPYAVRAEEIEASIVPRSAPERVAVVTAFLSREAERFLEGSAWGPCRRFSVLSACGRHEAAGGFALASATSLVAQGLVDEALAVGTRSSMLWLTRFSRIGAE